METRNMIITCLIFILASCSGKNIDSEKLSEGKRQDITIDTFMISHSKILLTSKSNYFEEDSPTYICSNKIRENSISKKYSNDNSSALNPPKQLMGALAKTYDEGRYDVYSSASKQLETDLK
ncbi:MAG: hypothetical protein AB7S48_15210 [Bacteroidales bacterium]